MKKDFDRANAIKLGEAYAEKALVATVSVNDNAPKGAMQDFMAYLKAEKVPHEVLFVGENSITFATTRDPEVDTLAAESKTRKMVAGFFTGPYAKAFNMEAYYQKRANNADVMDEKVIPFDRVKRSVHKRAA